MRTLLSVLLLLTAAVPASAGDFETLTAWLTGSFGSQAQAAADSSYFDIRLEMHRIWPDRDDGAWLYVEQAAAGSLDRPYRQRVYHLEDLDGGRFRSTVYALPDPAAAVGAWRRDAPLADLEPDDLVEREGCAVVLERRFDGAFVGGTRGRDCTSDLRGATWASSGITVTADRIVSWDRGWNDAGEQVWGAEGGGYVFLKAGAGAR